MEGYKLRCPRHLNRGYRCLLLHCVKLLDGGHVVKFFEQLDQLDGETREP